MYSIKSDTLKNKAIILASAVIGLSSIGVVLNYVFRSKASEPTKVDQKPEVIKQSPLGDAVIDIAKDELSKNVRDVFKGHIIDRSGNLYSCIGGLIPTGSKQESAIPIFNYLDSVDVHSDYYGNEVAGTVCSLYAYSWCGAFVSYCWRSVNPDIRRTYFPSVSSIVGWAWQDPRRFVSDGNLEPGDILVFQRPGNASGHHMGLFEGYLSDGRVATIEGNTYGFGQTEGVCRLYRYFKDSVPSGESYVACAIRPLSTDLI